MKAENWAQVAMGAGLAVWAVAQFAAPMLPAPDSHKLKAIELVISATASIGTAAAVFVALHFGLKAQRDQAKQAVQLAQIAGVRMAWELVRMQNVLRKGLDAMQRHKDLDRKRRLIIVIESRLRENQATIDDIDVVRLGALRADLPQRLAAVTALIQSMRATTSQSEIDWANVPQATKEALIRDITGGMQFAVHQLKTVYDAVSRSNVDFS